MGLGMARFTNLDLAPAIQENQDDEEDENLEFE